MSCQQHGWNPPPGTQCPTCLWDAACQVINDTNRLEIVAHATACALSMMPNQKSRQMVEGIIKRENRWKALKIAKQIRQEYLTGKRAKARERRNYIDTGGNGK